MDQKQFNELRLELESFAYKDGEYHSGRMNSALGRAFKQKLSEIEFTGFLTVPDKIFALKNGYLQRPSCDCGDPLKVNANGKMQLFCSSKCAANSNETIQKRENTTLKKYGVQHVSQLQETQDKTRATNMEKYGAPSSWAGKKVIQKKKETCVQKYGVENPAQAPFVISKIKEAHANRTEEEKEKTRQKTSQTSFEKYGVSHHTKDKSIRKKIGASNTTAFLENDFDTHIKVLEENNRIIPLFTKEEWIGSSKRYKWKHLECGREFEAPPRFSRMAVCPFCKRKSKVQQFVEQVVLDAGIEMFPEDRKAIHPYELDIYIPSKNLAIEVNGTYWHHDLAPQLPLLQKTKMANQKGISLLHFWDHEISEKPEIIKNIILAKLGALPKIHGRKLEVRTINSSETRQFFEKYHLQGTANSSFSIGVFDGDELVQAASFGTPRFGAKEGLELIRFASKPVTVHGGFSKIMKHLKSAHAGKKLVTFADRRISNGDVYRKSGFVEMKPSGPNYFYIKNGALLPRYKAMKHKLPEILEVFNPSLSEVQNMRNNGWDRCLDCGNFKFEIIL